MSDPDVRVDCLRVSFGWIACGWLMSLGRIACGCITEIGRGIACVPLKCFTLQHGESAGAAKHTSARPMQNRQQPATTGP